MNEYLRSLCELVPVDWTPASKLGEWAHLNELAQDGYIEERVETLYDESGRKCGSRFHYRRLTAKERELQERVKASERLEQYYIPWAEKWREKHGDEPVPTDTVAQWVEKAKRLQAETQKPGAYYTPRDVCDDVHIHDPVQGSGGFLAVMSNPGDR